MASLTRVLCFCFMLRAAAALVHPDPDQGNYTFSLITLFIACRESLCSNPPTEDRVH